MKRVKRTITLIAALALMISCLGGTAFAASKPEPDGPQASPTLTGYSVILKPGTKSGELRITFDVTATGMASSLGASYIKIYKEGSSTPVTIYGTTANRLIGSGSVYAYTYSYTGATPGAKYYAVVAIFAEVGDTFDSRTLRTTTVTAP